MAPSMLVRVDFRIRQSVHQSPYVLLYDRYPVVPSDLLVREVKLTSNNKLNSEEITTYRGYVQPFAE
jgi:hypothetical protein